mgnify:CR=1 FL=1
MAATIHLKFPPLVDYQRSILEDEHRYTITEASTKAGKTASHIVWLIDLANKEGKDGRNYWWIAPVYATAKIAFTRMRRYLSPLRRNIVFNTSSLTITLWNGAVLWFKTAEKPDNLFGEDVYGAVFDEFTRAKEESWFALRSTITATRAKVKFIGNKTFPEHWGSKLAERAEKGELPDWSYRKITCWDAVEAGVLDRDEVEDARSVLPDDTFQSLYEAKWVLINGNPYWREFNKAVNIGDVVYDKRHPVYLSFDFNKRNTCIVTQRYNGFVYVVEEYYMLGGHGEDLEELVKVLAMKYGKNILHCTGDASGRNASALTTGNVGAWQLIEQYFIRYKAMWVNFDQVPTFNLGTDTSRMIVNALLKHYREKFVISRHCVTLLSDMARMMTLSDGKLDKKDCDKHDYGHCFVAGTMVETLTGPKPIEQVAVGEYVLTRKGFKCVKASGVTRLAAKVRTYNLDGHLITCTDDHPIYTKNRGFIQAEYLLKSDIFCNLTDSKSAIWKKKQLFITALNSVVTQPVNENATENTLRVISRKTEYGEKLCCTVMFMNVKWAKFLPGTISIIKTKTRPTIPLPILNYSQVENISLSIGTKRPINWSLPLNPWTKQKRKQKHGMVLPRAWHGIVNTLKTFLPILTEKQKIVGVAKKPLKPFLLGISVHKLVKPSIEELTSLTTLTAHALTAEKYSVPADSPDLNAVRELALSNSERIAMVYDLTVEDQPEFFANGILVHNCGDCMRYDLTGFEYDTFVGLGYSEIVE